MVAAERRRRFVGRTSELTLFAAALATDRPAFAVLHVNGVGGVGKSALLRYVRRSGGGRPGGRTDRRPRRTTQPGSFVAAFEGPRVDEPFVVLVDSYELLGSLDDWLRRTSSPGFRRVRSWCSRVGVDRRRDGATIRAGEACRGR